MGGANVTFVVDADTAKAVQAYLKLLDAQNKNVDASRKLGKASQRGGRQMQSSLRGAGRELKTVAAGIAGFATAAGGIFVLIDRLKQEYALLVRRQQAAGDKQISVGDARAMALQNKPNNIDTKWLDELVKQTASDMKVDRARAWRAASDMLSAKGGLSKQQFKDAYRSALQVGGIAGPEFNTAGFGASIMDIMGLDKGINSKQASGWLKQVGQAARVVDPEKQYAAIPAVAMAGALTAFGAEGGVELWAQFTGASGDTQGRRSATAAINFMNKIKAGRTKQGALIPEHGFNGQINYRPIEGKGFEALAEIQDWWAKTKDPELRQAFLERFGTESRMKPAVEGLLSRREEDMQRFAAVRRNISAPTSAGVEKVHDQYLTDVALGEHENVRRFDRTFSTASESNQLNNKQGLAGVARKRAMELLKTLPGISQAAIDWAGMRFELLTKFGTAEQGKIIEEVRKIVVGVENEFGYGKKYLTPSMFKQGWEYSNEVPEGGQLVVGTPDRVGAGWGTSNTQVGVNPNYDPESAVTIAALKETLRDLQKAIDGLRDATIDSQTGGVPNRSSQVMD